MVPAEVPVLPEMPGLSLAEDVPELPDPLGTSDAATGSKVQRWVLPLLPVHMMTRAPAAVVAPEVSNIMDSSAAHRMW